MSLTQALASITFCLFYKHLYFLICSIVFLLPFSVKLSDMVLFVKRWYCFHVQFILFCSFKLDVQKYDKRGTLVLHETRHVLQKGKAGKRIWNVYGEMKDNNIETWSTGTNHTYHEELFRQWNHVRYWWNMQWWLYLISPPSCLGLSCWQLLQDSAGG